MYFMSGTYAAKALEQHLCEWFHYPNTINVFIFIHLITIQTQILLSRGFVAYVPDIFFPINAFSM